MDLHGNSSMYQFRLTLYSHETADETPGSTVWEPREEIGQRRFTVLQPGETPADIPNGNAHQQGSGGGEPPASAILRDPVRHARQSYSSAALSQTATTTGQHACNLPRTIQMHTSFWLMEPFLRDRL